MYTAKLLGDTKNIELRRRMVNVQFDNGIQQINKEFQFKIDETLEVIKRTVKEYLDELNFVPPTIADLTVVEVTPSTPTVAELAETEWRADWAKLQVVQEMIAAGVLTGTEAAILALRKKVKDNFKPAYL